MTSWVNRVLLEAAQRMEPAADAELIADLNKISRFVEHNDEALFWHPETDAILDELELADTLEEVTSLVLRTAGMFDLQHVTIAAVREAAGVFPHRVLTTFPPAWVQEYCAGKYQLCDPLFGEPGPGRWEFLDDLASRSPISADYLRRASCAGIGPSGIVSWTNVSEGTRVVVMLTSSRSQDEFRRRLERFDCDLAAITGAFARAFARANLPPLDPGRLSDEELTILRSIARGSLPLGFSDPSQECRPMGVKTLLQAAMAVASSGILSHAPLRREDFWFAKRSSRSEARLGFCRPSVSCSRSKIGSDHADLWAPDGYVVAG